MTPFSINFWPFVVSIVIFNLWYKTALGQYLSLHSKVGRNVVTDRPAPIQIFKVIKTIRLVYLPKQNVFLTNGWMFMRQNNQLYINIAKQKVRKTYWEKCAKIKIVKWSVIVHSSLYYTVLKTYFRGYFYLNFKSWI